MTPATIYTAVSGQADFNVNFPYLDKGHVKVKVDDVEVPVQGWVSDTKLTILPQVAGARVKVYRETPTDDQLVKFVDGAVLTKDDLNLSFIQSIYALQESQSAAEEVRRSAVKVPAGHPSQTLPTTIAGKFLGGDADGKLVALSGLGADPGFRTDFASKIGASLGGTTSGLSIQAALDIISAESVRLAYRNPPGCAGTIDYGSVTPNLATKGAAVRVSSSTFMVRVARPNGITEEYVFKFNGGYAGVNGGARLRCWRAFTKTRVWNWLVQPLDDGVGTTTEFAGWIGTVGAPYSSEENNDWKVFGNGHGHMTSSMAETVVAFDGAPYQTFDTWPVGEIRFFNHFSIQTYFYVPFPGTTTTAVRIMFFQNIETNYGLREEAYYTADAPNVALQTCAFGMLAANSGSDATRAKLKGVPGPVPLVGSGGQKGNWTTTTSDTLQLYNHLDPTVVATLWMAKGPVVQNAAETLAPYQLCKYGRVHVTDQADFAKITAYAVTAEEGFPRTPYALSQGTYLRAVNFRKTEYLPNGPE